MNEYTFEQIYIGLEESFEVQITDEMQNMFMKMSGDTNVLHTESNYAREKGFDDKVVYGMLTASLYSKLVGVYLPGKYCLLQEINVKFKKPIYIGNLLYVKGKVVEKNDVFKRVVIKAEIYVSSKKACSAKITVGVVR